MTPRPGAPELDRAPHVLLVSYFFPPATGGGVPRPVKMAKYLRRLGWTVTVLTVAAPGAVDELLDIGTSVPVVRVREWRVGPLLVVLGAAVRLLRRTYEAATQSIGGAPTLLDRGFAYEEKEIESSKIGWVIPAFLAARKLHRSSPIDVAIVSLPPASSGTVGWLLRRTTGVPYVVEYRDPWTVGAFWTADADGRPRTDPATTARLQLTSRLEAALLRSAAAAIVVNGAVHIDLLRQRFQSETVGKPVVQIRNGVDLEDVQKASERTAGNTVQLLHTGFFYHFYTPHHLVKALFHLQETKPEALAGIRFDFVGGGFPEELLREVRARGLGDVVRALTPLSYSESLAAMRGADGLVAVVPPLRSDDERLPTKLYEYLATDRPILAIASPGGAVARLLAGVPEALVADSGDQEVIADSLIGLIRHVRRQLGVAGVSRDLHRADAHHYRERATEMDELLREVVSDAARTLPRDGHAARRTGHVRASRSPAPVDKGPGRSLGSGG